MADVMTLDKKTAAAPVKRKKKKSNFVMVWRRLMQDKVAVTGLVILAILVLVSVFGPMLPGLDPNEMHLAEQFQGPSAAHWFGTDDLGRDIFARIVYGGRYSLALGFIGSVFTALIGTVCGTIIGYFGGAVDNFFMRVCDVWQAIPGQLLAIVISTTLGAGFINTSSPCPSAASP